MLKIWLALVLAVSAAVVSLIAGIIHDTRLPIVLYRAFVAVIVAGLGGFLAAILYERVILPYLAAWVEARQDAAAAAQPSDSAAANEAEGTANIDDAGENASEVQAEPSDFAPFTTDNFKRVSSPNS